MQCIYDNPHTYCRERWVNKKLFAAITAHRLATMSSEGIVFLGIDTSRTFTPGSFVGDVGALKKEQHDV